MSLIILLAGCAPRPQPPVSSPPSAPGTVPAFPGTPAEPAVQEIGSLPVEENVEFRVRAEKRSLAVVEHYDAELAKRGWKKLEPESEQDPGHREWVSTGMPKGPTDAYSALWSDPKTEKLSELNVWHTAEHPEIQQGTFEIRAKDSAP